MDVILLVMAKTKNDNFIIFLSLVIILLIMLGFGGVYYFNNRSNSVLDKGENIKVAYEHADVSNVLPKEFPQYPNSRVVSSWSSEGEREKGVSVIWETEDAPDKVVEYYNKALPEAQWKIITQTTNDSSTIISFINSKSTGFVAISKNTLTTISVTIGVDYE